MPNCRRCGKVLEPGDTITVADVGERCYECFNAEMADRCGVALRPSSFQPVELTDADGVPHTFQIRSMLVPTGHELEAVESAAAEGGYRFAVLGDVAGVFCVIARRALQWIGPRHNPIARVERVTRYTRERLGS
jgi:hypothetical protein